ncbi:E3 ubiquitin-protein ligase MARCH3-like [Myzus persicae]|uniref:E3 ubiquitin-protein ligase MARCH3-like n=1 Tax=Myzus persicae TaxID=13164 RepID=UPI000B92F988|nr:E3 ubiquitin-protein ligase MARCH3-like [Myzus persicae]
MLKSETQLPAIIESDNTTSIEVISLDQKLSTAFCKICYSGGSCEQLIHPCFCKGSVGNIHLTCLERWINECGIDRCELCLFQFTSDQTRRYTVWQSLVIWTRNPVHRSLLISDSIVMVVLTIVMACLITSVVMGMTVFSTSKSDSRFSVLRKIIFSICLRSFSIRPKTWSGGI